MRIPKIVPRDDTGQRHTGRTSHEAHENDLTAADKRVLDLERKVASLLRPATTTTTTNNYNPFAEMVFLAYGGNILTESGEGREFYIAPYTKYRLVVGQEGSAGADYDLQYYDSAWVDAGTTFTTGASDPVAYHSDWEDIPAGMLAFDMALLRVFVSNDVGGTDTAFISVQFWDGSAGTPPTSGGPLPT